jgi:hypothetical protein
LAFKREWFWGGVRALSLSGTVVRAGPLCTLGGQPPVSYRVADCHLVRELGFQLLDMGVGFSCGLARWEVLGLCALWGSMPSAAFTE